MSSGKKGTSIPMPNITEMLGQQNAYNRLNQYTPNGNLQYGKVGEDGQFQADSGQFPYAVQQTQTPHQQGMQNNRETAMMALAQQIGAQAMAGIQPLRTGNERPIEGAPLTGRSGLLQMMQTQLPTGGAARSMMPRR